MIVVRLLCCLISHISDICMKFTLSWKKLVVSIYLQRYAKIVQYTLKMKVVTIFSIPIFLLFEGCKSQAPPEIRCYQCKTGAYSHPNIPDCGDFGPGSPNTSSETDPYCYPGYCVKISGETAAGEAWTYHYCPPSSENPYGCRKLNKDDCNYLLSPSRSCEECVCGTDL